MHYTDRLSNVCQFAAKLLVTTTDALHVVDLNGASAGDSEMVIGNLSNPRGITYDFRGGYIFWSDESGHVTVIKRHSLRDGSTTPVLTHETLGYMGKLLERETLIAG